jgi:hypothetical protein
MEGIIAKLKIQKAALVAEVGRIDAAIAALSGATTPVTVAKRLKKGAGRKRRKMTAAEKRAVSERMKKSWAERKKKAARR